MYVGELKGSFGRPLASHSRRPHTCQLSTTDPPSIEGTMRAVLAGAGWRWRWGVSYLAPPILAKPHSASTLSLPPPIISDQPPTDRGDARVLGRTCGKREEREGEQAGRGRSPKELHG